MKSVSCTNKANLVNIPTDVVEGGAAGWRDLEQTRIDERSEGGGRLVLGHGVSFWLRLTDWKHLQVRHSSFCSIHKQDRWRFHEEIAVRSKAQQRCLYSFVMWTVRKRQRCQFWVTAISPGPIKAPSSTEFNYTTFYDTGLWNTWLAAQFSVITNQYKTMTCS